MVRYIVATIILLLVVGCGAKENVITEDLEDTTKVRPPVAELHVKVISNGMPVSGATVGFTVIQCDTNNHDYWFTRGLPNSREIYTLADGVARYATQQIYPMRFYVRYIRYGKVTIGDTDDITVVWPPLAMSDIIYNTVATIEIEIPSIVPPVEGMLLGGQ